MSLTPREIGTLIVVVLKANHLPNKRHIGKQDPYCVVSVNGEKRRTKAIKRGGQHPEWDEEIRFTLYEDVSDLLERTARGDGTPPPPPPKDDKTPKKVKGGKIMKLSCFADDPREPDLIGEADVDLTEVLTRGETDEWFTLMNKDKFSGKVYLELTFWSNEPPPEKKITPKPAKNKQYGGPGLFTPSGDLPSPLTNGNAQPSRIVSTGSMYDHSRQNSESIPASLRASTSLAQLDLYVPPYERVNHLSPMGQVATEFGEFSITEPHRRRESFPPPRGGHTPRPSSPTGYATFSHSQHGYDPNTSDNSSMYPFNQLGTQPALQHQANTHYAIQPPYRPQYETAPPTTYSQPHAHRPRHSIPTSSSGFIPLPAPSGFVSHSSHPSDPNHFVPPLSPNPNAQGYGQSQFNAQSPYTPVPPQTPVPTNVDPYLTSSSSSNFHSQLPFPPSQSFQYPQYAPSPPISGSPQQYAPPPVHTPQPPTQPSPQSYPGYALTSTPSHENIPPSITPSGVALSSFNAGSRPLPQQPQVVYAQPQMQVPYSTPSSSGSPQQQHSNSYSPSQVGVPIFPSSSSYQVIPPPPPPPIQYNTDQPVHQTYTSNIQQTASGPPPPPPPPPIQTIPTSTTRRQSSLPQPPVNLTYQQSPVYQQPPIPPPPPPTLYTHNQPPPPPPPIQITSQNSSFHSAPNPNSSVQQDNQGSNWIPIQSSQPNFVQQGY